MPSPTSSRPSRSASSTLPWIGQRTNAPRRAISRWIASRFHGSELRSYQRHFCNQSLGVSARAAASQRRRLRCARWPPAPPLRRRLRLLPVCVALVLTWDRRGALGRSRSRARRPRACSAGCRTGADGVLAPRAARRRRELGGRRVPAAPPRAPGGAGLAALAERFPAASSGATRWSRTTARRSAAPFPIAPGAGPTRPSSGAARTATPTPPNGYRIGETSDPPIPRWSWRCSLCSSRSRRRLRRPADRRQADREQHRAHAGPAQQRDPRQGHAEPDRRPARRAFDTLTGNQIDEPSSSGSRERPMPSRSQGRRRANVPPSRSRAARPGGAARGSVRADGSLPHRAEHRHRPGAIWPRW